MMSAPTVRKKPTRLLTKVRRTEAQFQAAVRQLALTLGWRVFSQRYALGADPGWPDIFAVRRERAVALELKGPKGSYTDEQDAWLMALDKAGVESYLFTDTEENWRQIEGLLR